VFVEYGMRVASGNRLGTVTSGFMGGYVDPYDMVMVRFDDDPRAETTCEVRKLRPVSPLEELAIAGQIAKRAGRRANRK